MTEELRAIKNILSSLPPPSRSSPDSTIWKLSKSGQFTISSAWDKLRIHGNPVDWYTLVWFKTRTPKHSFCLWLATRQRLGTLDRIRNPVADPKCLLCSNQPEDHAHLFFNCSFTKTIWRIVQLKSGFSVPNCAWSELISWMSCKWKNNNLSTISWKHSLAATVYYIWNERNARLHNSGYSPIIKVSEKILGTVKMKLSLLKGIQDTEANRSTQQRWDLPESIFL